VSIFKACDFKGFAEEVLILTGLLNRKSSCLLGAFFRPVSPFHPDDETALIVGCEWRQEVRQ